MICVVLLISNAPAQTKFLIFLLIHSYWNEGADDDDDDEDEDEAALPWYMRTHFKWINERVQFDCVLLLSKFCENVSVCMRIEPVLCAHTEEMVKKRWFGIEGAKI